ncbi:putative glycosyl transferase [Neisseria meningitidis]|nr:putative glycosyl transferase [Neisseria meningitidis]CWR25550.1 putative glycosyl transferase [Neisseria meningitidis]
MWTGFFSKSGTGIAEERHQNRRACTDVPLLAERNSKHPDRPYGFAKYRQSGLDIYAWHGIYFFPRFPFIDIDCIRWVCAGLKAFKHYIRENGLPDLIHAHCMNYAGILAFKISQKYGIPYVVTKHSSTITRGLIRPHQWQPMKNAAAHAAALLAVSRHFAHVLQHKYGCEWQYLPNILGGIFNRPFEQREKNNKPHFVFCTVSHLRRLKGHDVLLTAFARALAQCPQLRLNIGGSGQEEQRLKQQAADLGITHAVTFLGALQPEAVLDLMRNSDAFVLASRTETFGVVYIEALSQGLPVIATRCGGAESIVSDGNGYLVPVDDDDALADALIKMYEHHSDFEPARLRENCLNEFGENAVIGRLIGIFRQAIAEYGKKIPVKYSGLTKIRTRRRSRRQYK